MALSLLLSSVAYICLVIIVYLIYTFRKNYSFWADSGLPYIPFPRDSVFYPVHKSLSFQKFYRESTPHPAVGFYKMSRPYLMIRDPVLVRTVLIKDFDHFMDRETALDENLDPLHPHLFSLKGDRWKYIRQKLTPVFSSMKIKGMWQNLTDCEKELTEYLDRYIETRDELEVRQILSKFSMDVIGTCAFGLKCNAIQDEDCEFRKITTVMLRPSYLFVLKSFLRSVNPLLIRLLRWKRMSKTVEDFFFSFVRESVKLRVENAEERKDFMQHLINLQHEEQEYLKRHNDNSEPLITDAVVAAQTFVFFLAGFETTSGTMAYCLYELALHPDIMARCRQEVSCILKRQGTITYDDLRDMTYLQCVIDETMRKYPNLGWLERVCVKPYKLPDSSYTVKENTHIVIPVYALHHDPKYFPDPYKFDPERFNDENKRNIVPGTYLPFGDGPRICIGMRFAQMEMKATLATIIMKYNIMPTEKTEIPLKFSPTTMMTVPANGIWLRFKKRQTEA